MTFLRKLFLCTYTLDRLHVPMIKGKKEGNWSAFYVLCLNQITYSVTCKTMFLWTKQSSGEVYSTGICLAVLGASSHYVAHVNHCRGPQHLSTGATWFPWFLPLGSKAQKSSLSSAKYTINIPTCRKWRLECWAHNHQSGDQGKQRKVTRREYKLGELKCYQVPVTSAKDSNTCREES